MLGRIADELRQFAAQISQELVPPDAQPPAEVPDWLVAIVEPSTDFDADASEALEQEYAEGEEMTSEWDAPDTSYS